MTSTTVMASPIAIMAKLMQNGCRFDLCAPIASNRIKTPNQTHYLNNNDEFDYAYRKAHRTLVMF